MLLNVMKNLTPEVKKVFDNLFDENIKTFMNYGDVIVLMDNTDDFARYFPNYELEIHENN